MNSMIKLITRADDAGSSHSANIGTKKAIDAGFIKNVSLIAAGPFIEEAAEMFADREDICFGLHSTITAEWDTPKWGPVSDPGKVPSLVAEDGCFYQNPLYFFEHPPAVDEVMIELQAQLDKLHCLGFNIRYVDVHHMPFGRLIPSLPPVMSRWIAENGLINEGLYGAIGGFYPLLPLFDEISTIPGGFEKVLRYLPPGQYFYGGHPAEYSEEMRVCGEYNAYKRSADAAFMTSPDTMRLCRQYHVIPVRYDEADPPIVPIDEILMDC